MYSNGKPNYNEIVFTESEKENIKDMYLNGMSSVKIGKKYGVSHKPILKVLHEMNIEVNQKRFVRKHKLNESFFDIIDSEEKAYILGFFFADGYNSISKGTISMSLQEDDYEILELIRNIIQSDKPLEFVDYSNKHDGEYKYKNQYRLLLFSSYMCNTLESLGMVQNKSLVLKFPDIDTNLYRHFIRGYFDGDGSIYRYYKTNGSNTVLTITSTENFCNQLIEIVKPIGITGHLYDASCHNGTTKVFSICGYYVVKNFLDWIYKDATIYMARKYKRYLDYYDINKSLVS